MGKFYKSGLNSRELSNGLTSKQVYEMVQGIVMPLAIAKEDELFEGFNPLKVVENMKYALIDKYGKMSPEQQKTFRELIKKKYKEVLDAA